VTDSSNKVSKNKYFIKKLFFLNLIVGGLGKVRRKKKDIFVGLPYNDLKSIWC